MRDVRTMVLRPKFSLPQSGLELCCFLLFPLLVFAPMGTAPLLVAAGLFAFFLGKTWRWPALWTDWSFSIPFGLMMIWAALSAVWSVSATFSLVETFRVGSMWILGMLMLERFHDLDPADARRIRASFVIGAGLTVALMIPGDILLRLGMLNRMVPFNRVAVIQAIALGPLIAPMLAARRPGPALVLGVALFGVVAFQDSTTAKVSVVAGLAFGLAFFFRPRLMGPLVGVVCAIGILAAPLTFPRIAHNAKANQEMAEIKSSAWHRAQIWGFVGDRIAEKPVLGWGMNSSRAIPGGKTLLLPGVEILPLHPHNVPLQIWLELGLPGAVLFAAMSLSLWVRLGRSDGDRWVTAGRGAAMGAVYVSMIPGFGVWQEWWQASLWVVVAVMALDDVLAARRPAPGEETGG